MESADYAVILADMEAKKNALEAAITSLRAALAAGALGVAVGDSLSIKDSVALAVSPTGPTGSSSVSLPRGAFLGKTATDAIKLYLSAVRRKQTNKEIAQALKDGGLESTGSFDNYVTHGLFRLKKEGAVLRFDDGWGLAEWYPESFRSRVVEKIGNAGTQNGKKKKAPKKAKKTSGAQTVPASARASKAVGLEQRILDLFSGTKDFVCSPEEIAMALDVNRGAATLALGRLAAKRKLEKTEKGYTAIIANVQEMSTAKAS